MSITKRSFGKLTDGREVFVYDIKNAKGTELSVCEFGASMVNIVVCDKNGKKTDVLCGYDNARDYEMARGYQGAVVGRWANRIEGGSFILDGEKYSLTINKGTYHIHGGNEGKLSHILWESELVADNENAVRFSCVSPDGNNGYPGNLSVSVTYALTEDDGVFIHYVATTDKKTIISLTNHSYFNLNGCGSGSIVDHVLVLDADTYLETDDRAIPTGRIMSVEGTPFDFRVAKRVGDEIDSPHPNIQSAGGYDHCFNFVGWEKESDEVALRASVYSEESGIEMQVYTNSPCAQVYTANGMNDKNYNFKGGVEQIPREAICIETQRMPDSMNHEGFTKATLDVDEVYDYTTIYKFSAK